MGRGVFKPITALSNACSQKDNLSQNFFASRTFRFQRFSQKFAFALVEYSTFCINCFWTLLQAITEIQAALRGQAVRSKYIEQLDKGLALTDRDDAIVAIQSAMRGHLSRKKHVEEPGYELTSRDFRTRGR